MEFAHEDESNKRATATDIPELPAFTLCFWLRTPHGSAKGSVFLAPILYLYRSGGVTFRLALAGQGADLKLEAYFGAEGEEE